MPVEVVSERDILYFRRPAGKIASRLVVASLNTTETGGSSGFSSAEFKYGYKGGHLAEMVVKDAEIFNKELCFGQEKKSMCMADRYYYRWLYLKELGIPTVRTMRVVDTNRIIMGDMTIDGSEFMGKGKNYLLSLESAAKNRRQLTSMEKRFIEIYENGELVQEVSRVCDLMNIHSLGFPMDDEFDLLIHPDGSFEVLVLDLSYLNKKETNHPVDYIMSTEMCLHRFLLEIGING